MRNDNSRGFSVPAYMTTGIVLAGLLLSANAQGGTTLENVKATTVQFDAILELNSQTHGSHVLLFARYWVGPDFYSVGVVWGEPHGSGLDLSVYPPSLVIASDEHDFNIIHDVKAEYNGSYAKPLAERGVFRCMYGDYPVQNLRFAEQEARSTQIRVADFPDVNSIRGDGERVWDVPQTKTADGGERAVARVGVSVREGRILAMELFDSKSDVLKKIDYEYGQTDGQTHLQRQHVQLPEHPVAVGLQGDGIVVKVRDKEYKHAEFQATHHEGGRKAIVEYSPIALGDRRVDAPVLVTVSDAKGATTLRSARMMNFKRVELDAESAREAATRFAGFSPEERKYRELLITYWQKPPAEVLEADAHAIAELQSRFEDSLVQQDTLGGRLKHINMLMELDRMLGDSARLRRHYQQYLSLLSSNGLNGMLQAGGYGALATLMQWGRYADADALLDLWADAVLAGSDRESLLHFVRGEVRRGRLWTTCRLLDRSLAKFGRSDDDRFEILAIRCQVLHQVDSLCRNPTDQAPLEASAHARWAATSVGRERLERMLYESLAQAERSFDALTPPTEVQASLKRMLDKIGERLRDEELRESAG